MFRNSIFLLFATLFIGVSCSDTGDSFGSRTVVILAPDEVGEIVLPPGAFENEVLVTLPPTTTNMLTEVVEEKVEEDWAIAEPEESPEPKTPTQTDDEWGVMSGDWDDSGDTLTTAAAEFAQIQHENRRGEGPRDAAEQTLRPLPGTIAGEDGWYFDREGRPSHWAHTEENGWTQE